jgi:hypothetical protein
MTMRSLGLDSFKKYRENEHAQNRQTNKKADPK